MLFKILRRINSNFLRNGKNSFAGLEIQSVDFITSQKFRNFPADASSLALLSKLNTRSHFLPIEGDRIQWKIRKDEQLANSNYINSGDKAELEDDFERLRSMCGQTARRRLFLEQTTFRISVSGTPPTKIVGVVTRNHNFIELNVVRLNLVRAKET